MKSSSSSSSSAAEARAARAKSRAAKDHAKSKGSDPSASSNKNTTSSGGNAFVFGTAGFFSVVGFLVFDYFNNPKKSFVAGTPFEAPFRSFFEWTRFMEDPVSEKLIPDYPTDPYYAADDSPPGTPPRILLVLDVEKTLLGMEHDALHGWRYFKRPGLNQFLRQLAPYFEFVLHFESDMSTEAVQALVEEMQINAFLLGPATMQSEVDGTLVKRLDLMNRDLKRVILIDDDEQAAKMFPNNTLYVSPYEDKSDTDDTVLLDLIPMLQSLVHYAADDVRAVFDNLGSHNAEEVATEYRRRVHRAKQGEKDRRNKGIGKFIRENLPNEEQLRERRGSVLDRMREEIEPAPAASAFMAKKKDDKDGLVGLPGDKKRKQAPAGKKKTGTFMTWVKEAEERKAEEVMRKRERLNSIMAKKQAAAAAAAAAAAEES